MPCKKLCIYSVDCSSWILDKEACCGQQDFIVVGNMCCLNVLPQSGDVSWRDCAFDSCSHDMSHKLAGTLFANVVDLADDGTPRHPCAIAFEEHKRRDCMEEAPSVRTCTTLVKTVPARPTATRRLQWTKMRDRQCVALVSDACGNCPQTWQGRNHKRAWLVGTSGTT